MIFPDLYSIGSEIEKQTKNFVSNFLLAYLSYYDPKYNITEFSYQIGDEIDLSAYEIKQIKDNMDSINKLAKVLPLDCNNGSYNNIIVKHIIGNLFKGVYFKEKQFIASFTIAYLYKLGYYTKQEYILTAGSDLKMSESILLVMLNLDEVLGDLAPKDINNLRREEVLI